MSRLLGQPGLETSGAHVRHCGVIVAPRFIEKMSVIKYQADGARET